MKILINLVFKNHTSRICQWKENKANKYFKAPLHNRFFYCWFVQIKLRPSIWKISKTVTRSVRGHLRITRTRWRGSKNVCFCPRSGYKNCPRREGGGVKKWQNSVQVVVEWPQKVKGRSTQRLQTMLIIGVTKLSNLS